MYRARVDVDEHINAEMDRLVTKLEQTETEVRNIKNAISNNAKKAKQEEQIENKLGSIITKSNNAQEHTRSKKR